MPPLRPVPGAVEQLRIAQRGSSILLEWEAPSRNRDGTEPVELEEAELLRRVVAIPVEPKPVVTPEEVTEVPDMAPEEE